MTTFEQFFKDNPDQKEIYDKEYRDFLLSEFMLVQSFCYKVIKLVKLNEILPIKLVNQD